MFLYGHRIQLAALATFGRIWSFWTKCTSCGGISPPSSQLRLWKPGVAVPPEPLFEWLWGLQGPPDHQWVIHASELDKWWKGTFWYPRSLDVQILFLGPLWTLSRPLPEPCFAQKWPKVTKSNSGAKILFSPYIWNSVKIWQEGLLGTPGSLSVIHGLSGVQVLNLLDTEYLRSEFGITALWILCHRYTLPLKWEKVYFV